MNKVFNYSTLEEKGTLESLNLFITSFEYLVCKVSQVYSENNNLSYAEFNDKNILSLAKIFTYPFFISLSNGHSKSLYNLYGRFVTWFYAPISYDLFSLIVKQKKTNAFNFFEFDSTILANIKVKSNDDINSWTDLSLKIRSRVISLDDNCRFDEVLILSDEGIQKSLFEAIDNGINIVNSQSNKKFFNLDLSGLKLQASYLKASRLINDNLLFKFIDYNEIKDKKSRPYFLQTSG